MSELKEFPTQKEYDSNPEYFADFERRLEGEREGILKIVHRAGSQNDFETLENQLFGTGIHQAHIKTAMLTRDLPLWQKIEMYDTTVMYHDVIAEIHKILVRRRKGR